ncbi:TMV resistance protein N-like [Eucalyptus grandis]|uniref:TMV resistance protein N-like n=1 Tax=Eucalyptus grandis TaxID=71139 RepID=UPI000526AF38|nr:TMV resistance protein N-like [Eucalyptus grandis]
MASSDAGTSWGSEYQVFLSFRGPDTRSGFTDFLYHSLTDAGIRVFRNDEELRVGETIDGLLMQAINNCRIYIPIFSPNYASSLWCLRELSQIVTNTLKSEGNKEILPVFYDVERDDVILNTPLYRGALLNLECKKKLRNEQVDAWRQALMDVRAIKGWEVKKYKSEGEVIKLLVERVIQKLKTKQKSVIERLVGIDDRISEISNLLDINSSGVRFIKIYGMGGIGKTTLANAVFKQFFPHFGNSCFVKDVRAKSSRTNGLVELEKELLEKIGHPTGTRNIDEMNYGVKRTREALCNEKVLIVLDDVDNREQVEKLIGNSTLCSGSRILITTRDEGVLPTNTSNYPVLNYEMEAMSTNHAIELFSWHAFNKDSPSPGYNDLSREIVSTTGRLPLTLEVIGSFLYRKVRGLWIETLHELKKSLPKDVFTRLKISYNALDFEQQEIFLDIACFLIGEDKTNAVYMWRDLELSPDYGVDVLIRMSLVKIVENNKFWMHDQLRDLGQEIVHLENPIDLRARSRIWTCREVLDAIRAKEMDWNVQGLSLDSYAQRDWLVR